MADDIHNPFFGKIVWDDDLGSWRATIQWSDHPSEIVVQFDETESEPDLETAQMVIERLRQTEVELNAIVIEHLLERYNAVQESWHLETPMNRDALAQRVRLESVRAFNDGSAELCFDDDGIFAGHVVFVELWPDGTFRFVTIDG